MSTPTSTTRTGVVPPVPARMRAVIADRYGDPAGWRVAETAVPSPGEAEVLVAVRAAGVDRGVWHLTTGRPYLTRLLFGLRRPRLPVPGMDLAGVVAAVGPGATRWSVGDEVFGMGRGTYAEYAVAAESALAPMPARLSFEQAAVSPVSGMTAMQALTSVAPVRAGDRVLVIGASGGVGTFAVQIAKARGASVTGVAGPTKGDLVRSLGADHVLDYTREDYLDGQTRYDVIIDMGGLNPVRRLRRALAPRGTLVVVGGEGGGAVTGGFGRGMRAALLSPFVGQRLRLMLNGERPEDLAALADAFADGAVVPALDRGYPLARAASAVTELVSGRVRGKAVVVIGTRHL